MNRIEGLHYPAEVNIWRNLGSERDSDWVIDV